MIHEPKPRVLSCFGHLVSQTYKGRRVVTALRAGGQNIVFYRVFAVLVAETSSFIVLRAPRVPKPRVLSCSRYLVGPNLEFYRVSGTS